MGDRDTVHNQQERVIVVLGRPCQQIFLTEIPELGILKDFHIRVERVATVMNGRANQLTNGVPRLLILKVRADHQRIVSYWGVASCSKVALRERRELPS